MTIMALMASMEEVLREVSLAVEVQEGKVVQVEMQTLMISLEKLALTWMAPQSTTMQLGFT